MWSLQSFHDGSQNKVMLHESTVFDHPLFPIRLCLTGKTLEINDLALLIIRWVFNTSSGHSLGKAMRASRSYKFWSRSAVRQTLL